MQAKEFLLEVKQFPDFGGYSSILKSKSYSCLLYDRKTQKSGHLYILYLLFDIFDLMVHLIRFLRKKQFCELEKLDRMVFNTNMEEIGLKNNQENARQETVRTRALN